MQDSARGRGGTAARPEYVKEVQHGDVPAPRFGHTTTLVGNNRVVLFGGATGEAGRYTITADTYVLDVSSNEWTKIQAEGNLPAARAAHAAACVDNLQMVIFGGAIGGGCLASDELFLFDIRSDNAKWISVPVTNATPGCRYGHTLVFHRPSLIVFGGNTGQKAECDIWVLDVTRSPFSWSEVSVIRTRCPLPRVYHSAEACREGPASGMMVVFGGRTCDSRSLKDTWGLRQHRDGRWDWVEAPIKRGQPPEPRFQHSAIFLNCKLLIIGGRGQNVEKPLPTAVYDTETCEWRNVASVNRFRHHCWGMGQLLFSYGGFDHKTPSAPTADLQVLDLERAVATSSAIPSASEDNEQAVVSEDVPALRAATSPSDSAANTTTLPCSAGSLDQGLRPATPPRPRGNLGQPGSKFSSLAAADVHGDVRVSNQVFVSMEKDFTHLVKKVNIDSLEDEGKKIVGANANVMANVSCGPQGGDLASYVIDNLLQPTTWKPEPDLNRFLLHASEVSQLCDQALEIFKREPMVLKLRAPIKVYGDIHGQYLDLMRLFARYLAPTDGDNGDIDSMDYLFLGDFVDRGLFSLETICLLFALKIRYPSQIHLIRGNHEDPTINSVYGFLDECRKRLGEDCADENSCWNKFNRVFEWLPVSALIEGKILCLHGGIGGSISDIKQISAMRRPLHVAQTPKTQEEQCVTDLLWSDPSDHDGIQGVTYNETRDPDGSGCIVKFGPDRVDEFLKVNPPLSMLIRAHECVMDGFERFANGKLITVFSATDYCGHHKNAGALLFIRRDLTIVPKLIYPQERTDSTSSHWNQSILEQRPPTPPRSLPKVRHFDENGGSDW